VLENDADIQKFDRWLIEYAEKGLRAVVEVWPVPINTESLVIELQLRFIQRVEHWKSQARWSVSDGKSQQSGGNKPKMRAGIPNGDPRDTDRLQAARRKLEDPSTYRTMTVKEVNAVISNVSESTIYRWAEEGKLRRAHLGKKQGGRARMLILTASVVEVLRESSE